jgi:hypothetical protein
MFFSALTGPHGTLMQEEEEEAEEEGERGGEKEEEERCCKRRLPHSPKIFAFTSIKKVFLIPLTSPHSPTLFLTPYTGAQGSGHVDDRGL